jgi:hypothetical protein
VSHGLKADYDTIAAYLRAKGALIRYFRIDGKSFTELYGQKLEEPRIAGVILPEWVLALKTIVELVGGGLTITQILRKNLKSKADKKQVTAQADTIGHIDEVRNLTIIVNQAKRDRTDPLGSKKRLRKRKGSHKK